MKKKIQSSFSTMLGCRARLDCVGLWVHCAHISKHLECGSTLGRNPGHLTPAHSVKEETSVQRGEGTCLWLKAEWGLEPKPFKLYLLIKCLLNAFRSATT